LPRFKTPGGAAETHEPPDVDVGDGLARPTMPTPTAPDEIARIWAALDDCYAQMAELQGLMTAALNPPRNARNAGRKPVLSDSDVADIRAMYADGLSIAHIARVMGCARGTVKRALEAGAPGGNAG